MPNTRLALATNDTLGTKHAWISVNIPKPDHTNWNCNLFTTNIYFLIILNILHPKYIYIYISYIYISYICISIYGRRQTLYFDSNGSRAASSFAPSKWETVLLCSDVSHWLGANLESALGSKYICNCSFAVPVWWMTQSFVIRLLPLAQCHNICDENLFMIIV